MSKEIRISIEIKPDGTTAAYTVDTWDREVISEESKFYSVSLYLDEDGQARIRPTIPQP